MTYSDKASFLAEVEPLTHHQRTRAVVELGRSAASGDARAQGIIAALGDAERANRISPLMRLYPEPLVTKAPPKDLGASVRTRPLHLARERGEDFQLLLTRHANECLLFRLASSRHARRGQTLLSFRNTRTCSVLVP